MRVLICGSRKWDDEDMIRVTLNGLVNARGGKTLTVIHGDARGADRQAGAVAASLGLTVKAVPAAWEKHDRRSRTPVPCSCPGDATRCVVAGVRRNQRMIDAGKPSLVVAFHEYPDMLKASSGSGTYDMLCRAAKAKIPAYFVSPWLTPF